MLKKLLVILSVIVVFEVSLYILQAQQIKKLDQIAKFQEISRRTTVFPSHTFGELLAYQPKPQVLAEVTEPIPTTEPVNVLKKQSYVIAAIGDSMVETMGGSLDYLKAELKNKYPDTEFAMYNLGIGAEKVAGGLARFDETFKNFRPDVLIVGSYAYNPFNEYSRNEHWLALADLVVRARAITPNVYILAEAAPVEQDFGKGPGGVNWPPEIVAGHVPKIVEQMENAIGLSKILGIPLINVYDKTRSEGSKYGKVEFVSSHDHIHPSVWGHVFTAQQIANTIHLD